MNIENVSTSQTHALYLQLLNEGFNASLTSCFQYTYDKDNSYLSITVREAEERLNELYDLAKEFEIVVVKYAQEGNVCFEIRKHREAGEFVTDPVWREYYNSLSEA